MRLIDADELKEGLRGNFKDVMGNFVFNTTFSQLEAIIDTAPTVEPQKIVTIPPELIEKFAVCVVDTIGNIDWEKAIEAYKARPHGSWLNKQKEGWNCSECGEWSRSTDDFCKGCGADMRGDRE